MTTKEDTWLGHREMELDVAVGSEPIISDNGHGTRAVYEKMTIKVEVWLSERGLFHMIRAAAHNKSGKSKDGALRVKLVSRKPVR